MSADALDRAHERLAASLDGVVKRDEPLARHTSFRVGGPARLFIECDSLSDLRTALEVLADAGLDWIVLGKGTNVLVSDEGFDGAVLVLGSGFRHWTLDGTRLRAGAGVPLAVLVQAAYRSGLTGLEFAVGIPGTLGGALVMNAGSGSEWIDRITGSVTVFDPGRGLNVLGSAEISWGYRRSSLSGAGVVVEATLRLEQGEVGRIRQVMEASLRRRRRTQPVGAACAGSVFTNPPGDSAGRLIEAAGLKGARIGGAMVSDVHANFIVNTGGATASDIASLIRRVREAVSEVHGVELRPEIRFVGSFETAKADRPRR